MRSTLHHPDNDHWQEWREAVKRTGYTPELRKAAFVLLQLDFMTPKEVESYFFNPCRCIASTNIADEVNYGTGPLDFNGFWEFPCTHREHTETD